MDVANDTALFLIPELGDVTVESAELLDRHLRRPQTVLTIARSASTPSVSPLSPPLQCVKLLLVHHDLVIGDLNHGRSEHALEGTETRDHAFNTALAVLHTVIELVR